MDQQNDDTCSVVKIVIKKYRQNIIVLLKTMCMQQWCLFLDVNKSSVCTVEFCYLMLSPI